MKAFRTMVRLLSGLAWLSPQAQAESLLFQLNADFNNDVVALAWNPRADSALASTIRVLKAFQVQRGEPAYALVNPNACDKTRVIRVLDQVVAAGLSFVLDVYASDNAWGSVLNCAYDTRRGVALAPEGGATDPGALPYYRARYGSRFAGIRLHEVGSYHNHVDGFYDPALYRKFVEFAFRASPRMFVQVNENLWDHELYLRSLRDGAVASARARAEAERQAALAAGETEAAADALAADVLQEGLAEVEPTVARGAQHGTTYRQALADLMFDFPDTIIVTYATNDGSWICRLWADCQIPSPSGAWPDWADLVTTLLPVTSRTSGWGPGWGARGFGVSAQSWMTGMSYYDPDGGPGEMQTRVGDIIQFARSAAQKNATLIQLEPYWYFFHWNRFVKHPELNAFDNQDWRIAGRPNWNGCTFARHMGVELQECTVPQPRRFLSTRFYQKGLASGAF